MVTDLVDAPVVAEWYERGKKEGSAYLLILYDLLKHKASPEFLPEDIDAKECVRSYLREESERLITVLSCYKLSEPLDSQLKVEWNW